MLTYYACQHCFLLNITQIYWKNGKMAAFDLTHFKAAVPPQFFFKIQNNRDRCKEETISDHVV